MLGSYGKFYEYTTILLINTYEDLIKRHKAFSINQPNLIIGIR